MLEGSDASSSQRDSGPVPLIQVRDLKIQFAKKEGLVKAVDGVSFDLFANEIFGIVGETGSGKSITARSLIGLVPVPPAVIAGGSVIFRPSGECPFCKGNGCTSCLNSGRAICAHCGTDGCSKCSGLGRQEIDLLRLPNARMQAIRGMRIAMVFQDASKSLNPVLSIRDQIAEVFLQHRGDELLAELGDRPLLPIRRAAHQKGSAVERQLLKVSPFRGQAMRLRRHVDDLVAAALAEVQIANPRKVMDSFPHELSGGMKQRVMIAQAMACDPDVLIADEPTTALDTTVQARIIELIVEMQRRTQAAVLYISHDLSVVRTVCDRVGVMYGGQLVETGPARDVLGTPRHPYTRALLAAVPAMGRRRGELAAIKVGTSEVTIETPNCRFHTRCPQAVELCSVREPHLQEVARGTSVACFGYGATEPNELPADLGLPVVPRSEREQEDHRG